VETASSQMGQVVTGPQMTSVALSTAAATPMLLALQQHRSHVHAAAEFHRHGRRTGGDRAFRRPESRQSIHHGQREDSNGFMVNGGDVRN